MDKILIIDDEKNLTSIIKYNLDKEGYATICAYNGLDGLRLAQTEDPQLIILDVMMPKLSGFEVCKRIRETSQVPIIMLTARAEEVDRVLGLDLGADDYITKPFGVRELTARVRANLRRSKTEPIKKEGNKPLVFDELVINPNLYEVKRNGVVIELTRREFDLIKFLATQNDKVFSREHLLEHVWGYEYIGDVRTVDVTVRRLRIKIEKNPDDPQYVLTRRGVGYYFCGYNDDPMVYESKS